MDIVCVPNQQHLVACAHTPRGVNTLRNFAANRGLMQNLQQGNGATELHVTMMETYLLANDAIADRCEIHIKPFPH